MAQRYKSTLNGKDTQVIPRLLDLHCEIVNPIILDVTHNRGVMWSGIKDNYNLITMDKNPLFKTDVVADFTSLPFASASIDVIVFDPPHLPVAGASETSSIGWEVRYGITAQKGKGRDGDNVDALFEPFLVEAKRVLRKNGLILAKIADLTHNHHYQWQHISFINAVVALGLTACDLLIKIDPSAGNLESSMWENINHLRKEHCYWIVVRNGTSCERSGVKEVRKQTIEKEAAQLKMAWI